MKSATLMCVLFCIHLGLAQTAKKDVVVNGKCNGVAVGENITVTVNCADGITKADAAKLARGYADVIKQVKQANLKADDAIARLQQRHLTDKQVGILGEIRSDIAKYPEQFMLLRIGGDQEVAQYADEFAQALGLNNGQTGSEQLRASYGVDIAASVTDVQSNKIPPTCEAVVKAFTSAGITFQKHAEDMQPGKCQVTIGYKPKPDVLPSH